MSDDLFKELGLDFSDISKPIKVEEAKPVKQVEEVKPVASSIQADALLGNKTPQEITQLANSCVAKLKNIEVELNQFFVERESVIKDAIRALVIGQHMLLLGPPGTGKSLMVRKLCARIDGGQYFEWLLNRTSDPAEILGPYSIKAMEQDKFLRKVKGKLPEAHIAFIDEIDFSLLV